MKLLFLFYILVFVLAGCATTLPGDNNSGQELQKNTEPQKKEDSDTFYLKVARDLYVARQYKQAFQITTRLAEKNNAEAQYLLGYLHYYGQGAPVDIKEGQKWISISADSGYRPAIEALVLIKHGLTPDNKCSSVELDPDESSNADSKAPEVNAEKKIDNDTRIAGIKLKADEELITPETSKPEIINNKTLTVATDVQLKRYTIQLIYSKSKQVALDYALNIKNKYPDLKDNIILYKTINKPTAYGIGFSSFDKFSDAKVVLVNLQSRLSDASIFVKNVEKYTLLNNLK